ncbi:MAG TPA: hypothetical protein VFS09_00920 [Candidatus Eisenbacteria bacterium]|nr:hypothetical protein [Candidatus Eisenbacteria bacterium]
MNWSRFAVLIVLVALLGFSVWLIARHDGDTARREKAATEGARPPAGGTAGVPGAVEQVAGEKRDLLESVERDWLRRAGFTAPAESLRADLLRHPELIPTKGVVGGTMAFRPEAIYLLPGGHVWAIADDGHIETALLLRYEMRRDTTVEWSVVYHRDEP